MSYYIIGIGGTGAKCVEALTHLCAAGLMPTGELNVLFVDPDQSNGSLQRAQLTLNHYCECKKNKLGETELFKTPISIAKPDVWTPFDKNINPTLENFFHYSTLKTQNEAAAHLFDVLYSPDEKEVQLDEGFLGHPSIGAAVMSRNIKLNEEEPWKSFKKKVELETKTGTAKVVLIGSLFGGTGAAGIPTIARLIRQAFEKYENLKIGGIMILPYFSFLSAEKTLKDGKIFKLSPENFILNTQAALKYYHNQQYLDYFDFVYLLGEHTLVPVKNTSAGGNTQVNAPHFMELYASLAAVDFFKNIEARQADEKLKDRRYSMIARQELERLYWNDLPDDNNGNTAKEKLGRLTRFAFSYLNVYYPMLQDIKRNGLSYRAPWYVQFFERKKVSIEDDKVQLKLDDMKVYCETLLKWLACIQRASDELKIRLVQYNAFSEEQDREVKLLPADKFKAGDFENLISLDTLEDPNGLNRLWAKMSDSKVRDPNADEVGKFFQALFKESLQPAAVIK
jgi:hypothetical protein